MKAVIYARYSCDNQNDGSIDGQMRECKEFAERQGYEVIGEYIDRAYSAKTDKRPQFRQMIADSKNHFFDAIIVWKLDRFARNRYDSVVYKQRLEENGIDVISATENISKTSEGKLLESILEAMAELYSDDLAQKVIRGMTDNALKGKNNGGQITFGYKITADKTFEPHELYAPILHDIFTMYADGSTVKEIVDYLDMKGIRSYRGGKLNINAVQRILSNRRYIGEYKFRDTVIPNCIPPLVSKELFEQVQHLLEINKKSPARRKADEEYLLSMKLFCGNCGKHMVGESGKGTSQIYRYYKCANTKRVHVCNKKSVKKEWLEDKVIKVILEILDDKNLINYLTKKIFSLQGEMNPRIPLLKQQLADVERRITNIMEAIEQGIITEKTKERLAQLENEKKKFTKSIFEEEIRKPYLTKEQIRFGIERYKKLDIHKLENRQQLIDCFVNSIYLYDDRFVITFNLKSETRTIYLSEINLAQNSDINSIGAPETVKI